MNALNLVNLNGFRRAIADKHAALALLIPPAGVAGADRLETACIDVLTAGRTPIVLALGHLSPSRHPQACAHVQPLASGRMLNVAELLATWGETWRPLIDTTSAGTLDVLLDDLVKLMAWHTVWRRQRTGSLFDLSLLRQTARLDTLMAVLQPEVMGLDDPLSQRLVDRTRRYGHALGMTDDEMIRRDRPWPNQVLDQHGYNHTRITGALGVEEDLVGPLLTTTYTNPGWNARGWFDRQEVLLIGLGEQPGMPGGTPLLVPQKGSVDHDHLAYALRWILADVITGLPAGDVPATLTVCREGRRDELSGAGWLNRWAERQTLINALPDDEPLPGPRRRL